MNNTDEFKKLIDKIAKETNTLLPKGYKYRYAPYACWKCGESIIIFKWTSPLISGPIDVPPEPIPSTLKERYTSTSNETYWANVCPKCDSVQGDFFINCEPESPFFVSGEVVDSKEAFDQDMTEIADYYFNDPNCSRVL